MNTYQLIFVCFGLEGKVSIPAHDEGEIERAFNPFFRDCKHGHYLEPSKIATLECEKAYVETIVSDVLAEDFGVDAKEIEWRVHDSDFYENEILAVNCVS